MFNPYYIPLASLLPPPKETTKVHHIRKPAIPRCKSIKFRATFPKAESYGLHQVKEVVFALGLGPCGKHVLKLTHTVTDDLLTIVQTSRAPDDLEGPILEKTRAAEQALSEDRKLRAYYGPRLTRSEFVTTGHLWWKKTIEIKPENVHIKGLLTPQQVADYEAIIKAQRVAAKAWLDRLEVKTFVYKMSDVHGRIEVIQ